LSEAIESSFAFLNSVIELQFFIDLLRLFVALPCFLTAIEFGTCISHVEKRICFSLAIANLTMNV
jgi:hypothetical protein